MDPILIQTKLHRPRLPKVLVTRTRLIEQLNHDSDLPLILVCGPAGFGKTTLVSNWLRLMAADHYAASVKLPAAWLSLDKNDSDLNLFLRYFIAAVLTIFSDACENTLALIQAQQFPPTEVIFAEFINELVKLPEEFILVLDDYHSIHSIEVHNLLAELAHHSPWPLHLVLISRTSPPIALPNLRARGMLSELRTRELRFTPEETADYLGKTQFARMGQSALAMLEERFEGWPAGLHLAALSLRFAGSQEAVIKALSSENPDITGYLVDEVLSQQFPAILTFLFSTSILDRFCISLCEAVVGEIDPTWSSGACLEWIERSELFLIPLDDRREWYRYHHLFQGLLQKRLVASIGSDKLNELHLRASTWFEEQGLIDEAIHHALAAGDLDLAARQMSEGLCDLLNRGDRLTLERWLHLLPEEMIQRRPDLLMIRAWALQFKWQLDLQAKVLQQVEDLLDLEGGAALSVHVLQILRGQISAMKSQEAYFTNNPIGAIDLSCQALRLLPQSWKYVRGGAMLLWGLSMQTSGNALAAEQLMLDEFVACEDKTDVYQLELLIALCYININSGQLEQARQLAQLLVQGATSTTQPIRKSWGEYFLGVLHFHRNELETAEQYFTQIANNRFTAQITTYRDAVAGLAFIHQIKGDSSKAWRMVESISQFDLAQSGHEDERTRFLRARLMLMQGNLDGAGTWADTITEQPPDQPFMWLQDPHMTRVHILLSKGTSDDLRLAFVILDALDEIAERTFNTRAKIGILALRALALNAQGETTAADTILKQALDLARPGGFIRIFADLGKPMQIMLCRLEEQGHSGELIGRILAVFQEDEKYLVSSESPVQPGCHPSCGTLTLAEHLSPRELEVLTLLREPLSIKQIAPKLNISYATVRRHTINIYGKLGVNQRWEAVAKAEKLNLFRPH